MFCGNLHASVTEALLCELFVQVGPVTRVHMPSSASSAASPSSASATPASDSKFAFVEFRNEQDVGYAIRVLNNIRLWKTDKSVSIRHMRAGTIDVGANLFVEIC